MMAVETLLPKNAPAEYKDPAVLFNAIENYEKSENARTAKKIIVALPREFDSLESQQNAMREFCSQLTKMGYACTYAIHQDKDNNNPHAHVLITNRPINNKGEFVECKQKMAYVLDEKGERIPLIDKETGKQKVDSRNRKQWKRQCVKSNPLDEKTTLQAIRENWERVCNKRLEPSQQITAKSHADRGFETVPTIHEGYAAREIERRGGVSDRCELNRAIIYYNRIINALDFFNKQLAQLLMPKKTKTNKATRLHSFENKKSKELQPERAVRERFVREQRKRKEAEEKAKLEREKEQARQAELERQKQQYQPVYSPPQPAPRRSRGMSR